MCLLGSSGLKLAMLKQITNKPKRTEKDFVREMVRAINWDLQLCCSIVPLLLRIREFAPHTRKIKGVPSVYRYFPFVGLGDFYLKEVKLMAWYQKYSRVSLPAWQSTFKIDDGHVSVPVMCKKHDRSGISRTSILARACRRKACLSILPLVWSQTREKILRTDAC